MGIEAILFYFFAAILVAAATAVITVRNPVYAVLFLVLAFFTSAVLFLFVVMMLDINLAPLREGFIKYLPVGALVATVMFVEMAIVVGAKRFGYDSYGEGLKHAAGYSNTKELGGVLYTVYAYPFEIAAAILLVAIVAAIALTMRRRPQTKYQDPAQQVMINRGERIRLVKMAAEKKTATTAAQVE